MGFVVSASYRKTELTTNRVTPSLGTFLQLTLSNNFSLNTNYTKGEEHTNSAEMQEERSNNHQ